MKTEYLDKTRKNLDIYCDEEKLVGTCDVKKHI